MITDYKQIQGWFSGERLYEAIIDEIPFDYNIHYVVDVGTWLGQSTAYLGQLIKKSGKNIKIFAVDSFKGCDSCEFQLDEVKKQGGSIYNKFIQNMTALGLIDIITPIIANSWDVPNLIDPNIMFDFVYIDASHLPDNVAKDLNAYWPRIKNGGILGGDDASYPHETNPLVIEVEKFARQVNRKVVYSDIQWIIRK